MSNSPKKTTPLKMQSLDWQANNIEKIAELFPNCIVESKNDKGELVRSIDFDTLRQELSDDIVEGADERYVFTWPDKKQTILQANSPTTNTLRPRKCYDDGKEDSVDFDKTQNLYIEGDNLEVLKILQETYLHKVKMIYIDPPYNTGKDFIYKDNFTQNKDEYLEESGQFDEEGNRLFQNTESNGRFHTDWLNMIYPRLKLARNLLTDDGVIFISIDDNEVHNLRKVCDEVFGEGNFVANIVWQKKTGASDAKGIATITEYILVYFKNSNNYIDTFTKNSNSYDLGRYKYTDDFQNERGPYYIDNLDRGGLQYSDSLNYGIECPDGNITFPNGRISYLNDGWIWKWSKDKIEWAKKNSFIEFRKSKNKSSGWAVCYKNYLNVDNENNPIERAAPHKNMIIDILNANAAASMKDLFNTNKYFDYTKPHDLIKRLISYVSFSPNDIILDFFSGSATTAHAVMQLNAEDGGNRQFIMVQVPELTDEKSEAFKAGYANICEIGKERIRRAGQKIKKEIKKEIEEENAKLTLSLLTENTAKKVPDIGFRVLKLDSSNMKNVYYGIEEYERDLFSSTVDNIKHDRSPEDLLFQVMLELGVELSSPVREEVIDGKKVFYVMQNHLVACFDTNLNNDIITTIAKEKPYYFVIRDSSVASDAVLINFEQIFNAYSPDTIIKVL